MFRTIALAGASWVALLGAAAAQDAPAVDPREARIQALETQLAEIQAQLNDLKESSAADVQEVRRVASEQPVISVANGRPTISAPDNSFRFAVRTMAQYDVASYLQDDPLTPDNRRADTNAASDLNSGGNFRRARIGIEGTAFRDWNYALTYELGGTGTEGSQITQAYLEYVGWKPWETAAPIRFRIGAWATPTGLEDATSNTESLFLERAAPAELVRGIAGGDGRTGVGVFANGDRWYGSGVLTGATVANTGEFDEQTGFLLRTALLPLRGPDYGVHIGANLSGVFDPADTDASSVSQERIRLRERPELRNDTTRFVDTGNIASDGLVSYGVELGGVWRNFYVAGEAFQIDVNRAGQAQTPPLAAGTRKRRGRSPVNRVVGTLPMAASKASAQRTPSISAKTTGALGNSARAIPCSTSTTMRARSAARRSPTKPCAAASKRSRRSGSIGIPTTPCVSC